MTFAHGIELVDITEVRPGDTIHLMSHVNWDFDGAHWRPEVTVTAISVWANGGALVSHTDAQGNKDQTAIMGDWDAHKVLRCTRHQTDAADLGARVTAAHPGDDA